MSNLNTRLLFYREMSFFFEKMFETIFYFYIIMFARLVITLLDLSLTLLDQSKRDSKIKDL